MKILAVSDVTAKYYFDFFAPGKLDGFDLILACGDLSREYPKYFIYGHIHQSYGINIPQRTTYESTIIINAYDHCVFEF